MLIIDSKDCENIDKALKKYKKKFEKSKTLLNLRARQAFVKPSVKRRFEVLKAVYKQQIFSGKIEGSFFIPLFFSNDIKAQARFALFGLFRFYQF